MLSYYKELRDDLFVHYVLVTMSWESRRIYGGPPTPRGYHTAVLHDSRLYILGGYDGKTVFDDVYMLELSACAYLPQITNFEIDL